jgi:protein-tyrosine-phosphatase
MAALMMEPRVRDAADLKTRIYIQSAGTHAFSGAPMSPQAQAVLMERGCDVLHAAQRINAEILAWADVILTMTRPQKILLMASAPAHAKKIHTFKGFVGDVDGVDIDDPMGSDIETYRHCADEIQWACDRLLKTLIAMQTPISSRSECL